MRFKTTLIEQPRTSRPLAMFARRQGRYDRPIAGASLDIRMEDMAGLTGAAKADRLINFILPLPPISEAQQAGKFGIMNFGFLDKIVDNGPELQTLLASGKYLVLPDSPHSPYWKYTEAPWWEYAEVLDEYDGVIKAPLKPREGEPTADEVDELLDTFPENRGKLRVLSPFTIKKQQAGAIRESYKQKLMRI